MRIFVFSCASNDFRPHHVRVFTPDELAGFESIGPVAGMVGMMVGFGDQPYLTEFGPDGTVHLDAKFTGGGWNYRAFRDPWVGRPQTLPTVAVRRSGRDAVVYASWNGSTETAYWRVRTGGTAATLESARVVPRTGFETSIRLHGVPRVLTVTALDRKRNALATSKIVRPFV